MRTLAILFLAVAVYALTGVGGAAADDDSKKRQQTPESIVICGDQGIVWLPGLEQEVPVPIPRATLGVETITTPESIALERCDRGAPCAPCIRSLENQGCKVLDLIVNAGGGELGAVDLVYVPEPASVVLVVVGLLGVVTRCRRGRF